MWNYFTCGEISDFSTFVMYWNLKFLHMTIFSTYIQVIKVTNMRFAPKPPSLRWLPSPFPRKGTILNFDESLRLKLSPPLSLKSMFDLAVGLKRQKITENASTQPWPHQSRHHPRKGFALQGLLKWRPGNNEPATKLITWFKLRPLVRWKKTPHGAKGAKCCFNLQHRMIRSLLFISNFESSSRKSSLLQIWFSLVQFGGQFDTRTIWHRTIWHRRQFDTADNLSPWTIWHCRQFANNWGISDS